MLTIASLLTIVLLTLHVTDDITRGISAAGPQNIGAVAIFLVLLVGTLLLPDRRSGQVIMLVGGLFGLLMPVLHTRGQHYAAIAAGPGGFFFVWTLFAVGTTGAFAVVLALRQLWPRRGR